MAKAKTSSMAGGALQGAGAGAAIGGPWGALGGAAVGAALPALLGDGSDTAEQERALRQQILDEISRIPEPELQKLALEQYSVQGELDPALEEAILQGETRLTDISLDPKLRQAQFEALQSLQEVGRSGLRPEDKLALEQLQLKAVRDAEAQRQQILQNRQMRGVAGGGDELVAQLQASQDEANQARLAGMQRAAMAQQAALEGIAQAGSLGGRIEQQDYSRQSDLARARDEINRFNVQSQQGVQTRNIGSRNRAQELNLAAKQDIANRNIENLNTAAKYNVSLPQQQFQNQVSLAQNKGAALSGQAQALGQQAANEQAGLQNTLQGASQAALAGKSMMNQDAAAKRDEERLAIEKAKLTDAQKKAAGIP